MQQGSGALVTPIAPVHQICHRVEVATRTTVFLIHDAPLPTHKLIHGMLTEEQVARNYDLPEDN